MDRAAAIGDLRPRGSIRERAGKIDPADAEDISPSRWRHSSLSADLRGRRRARGASVTRQEGDSTSDLRLGRRGATYAARDDRAYSHRDGNASEARTSSRKNPATDCRTCSEVSAESAGDLEPARPACP